MITVQSQSTTNPCSVSQAAAVAALEGDQACVSEMTAAYQRRHEYIVAALNEIPGLTCRAGEGTFYAFPKVEDVLAAKGMATDIQLTELLLNEGDVAVVPGTAFGAPGHIRLSFACSMTDLEESVKRIKRVITA